MNRLIIKYSIVSQRFLFPVTVTKSEEIMLRGGQDILGAVEAALGRMKAQKKRSLVKVLDYKLMK